MKGIQMITREALEAFYKERVERSPDEVAGFGKGTVLAEKLAAAIHAGPGDRDAARAEATQYYFDEIASAPAQAEELS